MSERLVIIGASAMGRETCRYALDIGMAVEGFLDSRSDLLASTDGYPPIIGTCDGFRPRQGNVFVCAIGDPSIRREYVELMHGVKWATIVHPLAYVGCGVNIGEGSVVCPHVTVTCDVNVGRHVILNINASVSHDCRIGDFATLSPGCNVAGRCEIGCGAFLGVSASVIPDVKIGDGCLVAAGAVVTASTTALRVMGVPAKPK